MMSIAESDRFIAFEKLPSTLRELRFHFDEDCDWEFQRQSSDCISAMTAFLSSSISEA